MKTQSAVVATTTAPSKKLFYRINEVAKLTGVKAYVLRYWETEFPELAPEKDASDQRRYRAKDIQTIDAIRKLLYDDKFTIKGARGKLKQELKAIAGKEAAAIKPAEVVEVKAEVSEKVEAPRGMKPVNLYARALSENLSLIKKDIGELLKVLNAA